MANQTANQTELTTFILTDYFYEVVAEQLNINVENEEFTIIATIQEDEDSRGNLYDAVEIEAIYFNGNELNIPQNEIENVLQERENDILDSYYEDLAEGIIGKPYDTNKNRKALARMTDIIVRPYAFNIYDNSIVTDIVRSTNNTFEVIELIEAGNKKCDTTKSSAKLLKLCERQTAKNNKLSRKKVTA